MLSSFLRKLICLYVPNFPTVTAQNSSSHRLSGGDAAAIVIGVIVAVTLIFCLFCYISRSEATKEQVKENEAGTEESKVEAVRNEAGNGQSMVGAYGAGAGLAPYAAKELNDAQNPAQAWAGYGTGMGAAGHPAYSAAGDVGYYAHPAAAAGGAPYGAGYGMNDPYAQNAIPRHIGGVGMPMYGHYPVNTVPRGPMPMMHSAAASGVGVANGAAMGPTGMAVPSPANAAYMQQRGAIPGSRRAYY